MPYTAMADVEPLWNSGVNPFDNYPDPGSACLAQMDAFSPGSTSQDPYPFLTYWTAYQCQWTYSSGIDPSAVELECIDTTTGQETPYDTLEYPGVCVPYGQPVVAADGGGGAPDPAPDPPLSPISPAPDPAPPGGGGCVISQGAIPNPVVNNSVLLATGSLSKTITDYEDADGRLRISRIYRSDPVTDIGGLSVIPIPFGLGNLWRLNFQWDLALGGYFSSVGNFGVSTPGGGNYNFTLNADGSVTANTLGLQDISVQFVNPGGGAINYSSILSSGGQFLITTSGGDQVLIGLVIPENAFQYLAGRPLQITHRGGYVQTFHYGTWGELDSTTDNLGRTVQFTWAYGVLSGTSIQIPLAIQTIRMPDGTTLNYVYESYISTTGGNTGYARIKSYSRKTSSGTVADSATYLYTASASPALLTGIIDNAGIQYESWQYDSTGRVTSASHPTGADAISIAYANYPPYTWSTVTNALGLQKSYAFYTSNSYPLLIDVLGNPTTDCLGTNTVITYDANGRRSAQMDTLGNVTQFTYDSNGRIATKTEASGTAVQRTSSYTWNNTLGVPTQIAGPELTSNLIYDTAGRLTQRQEVDTTTQSIPYSTNGQTRTWTYTYSTANLLSSVTGPLSGNQTLYGYSSTGYRSSTTNALGQVTTVNSMNALGQPLTQTDPNGVVTTLSYDADQRLASRQTAGETTSYSYGPTGLLQQVTLPDASFIGYTYDSARRLTGLSDSLGNSIAYTLDALGNRIGEHSYDVSHTLHRTHTRVFNALSQIYQDVNAAGTSAVTTSFGYDADSNLTTINAPLSRNTSKAYDALNRLSQITDPASGVTRFGYDANNNLTSVTDPRSLTTGYTFDGFADQIQQVSPDTGTTVNTFDGGGNLSVSTDARGANAHYSYDALNRVTSIVYKNSSGVTDQTLAFGYDAGTNGKGRLTSAADGNQSLAWSYDSLGRVTGKGQTIGTLTLSVGYGYTNGDLTGIVTSSGQAIAYTYNSNHQITGIAVNGTTLLSNVTYEPFGGVNGWTWGSGSTVSRLYNGDGLISQIVSASVTNSYTFDNANRITGISDSSNSALSWSYGYDALDRLTSATTSAITDGWTYDADGNRLTQTGTSASTFHINSGNNQLSSTTGALTRTYVYNAAGMTTAYGSDIFSYNNRGRMSGATVGSNATSYLYNALGQLIEKSGSGTVVYANDEAGHILGEYNGSGGLMEETVWLGDIPVATLQPSGSSVAINYVHTNHLNTPTKVTRSSDNALEWRVDQDPFGTASPNQNPGGLGTFVYNLRFPGQFYMADTGLNYNRFRDYDPALGRYIEADPIGLNGDRNSYLYANGNTLWFFDLVGFASCCSNAGQSNSSCCAQAYAAGLFTNYDQPGGPDVSGITVCCGGTARGCANPKISGPAANIISSCTIAHENQHTGEISCPGCDLSRPSLSPGYERPPAECGASTIEVACLRKSISQCNGDPNCEAQVEARIGQMIIYGKKFGFGSCPLLQ